MSVCACFGFWVSFIVGPFGRFRVTLCCTLSADDIVYFPNSHDFLMLCGPKLKGIKSLWIQSRDSKAYFPTV